MKVCAVRAWCRDSESRRGIELRFSTPALETLSNGRTLILEGRFCNYGRIESTCGSYILVDWTAILPAKSDQQCNQVRSPIFCAHRDAQRSILSLI